MRTLQELNAKIKELKGETEVTYVAGCTIAEMLVAEPTTCKKVDFISNSRKLEREGKYYILVAEANKSIQSEIKAFLKEQARLERQRVFFNEVTQLNTIKLEKDKIKALENNPKIKRIRTILDSLCDDEDREYVADLLLKDVCLSYSERQYVKENIL